MQNANSSASTPDAAQPVIDAPAPEKTAPPAKPSGGLFNPRTRFGRFMRGLTRVLAIIVGLFALGMLATYLLLYRPLDDQAAKLKAELAQDRQQIAQLQADLDQSRQDAARLTAANQSLGQNADQAKARQALLAALAAVNEARYHLAAGDTPAAQAALAGVPTGLNSLGAAPSAGVQDARSRLDLVNQELTRDPKTAASDLAILADQISTLLKQP